MNTAAGVETHLQRVPAEGDERARARSSRYRNDAASQSLIDAARQTCVQAAGERLHWTGEKLIEHASAVAQIVDDLGLDAEAIAAAFLLDVGDDPAQPGEKATGPNQPAGVTAAVRLAGGVTRLAPIQMLRGKSSALRKSSEKSAQLEAVRKMLLAMVEDIRAVLLKLADQLQSLRYLAGRGDEAVRRAAARDTIELLAPLANRLGVWQLKWELEDLAMRCLEPETYMTIARELDERRTDRESYVEQVVSVLRAALTAAGLETDVSGRPKHIYSIWKKMQRKGLRFEQLSDVRAVRVLVDTQAQCYAALGVVHELWTPVPGEFDDYIARPKANDYRSLHTAVAGPEGKIIEVQIRTREMHQHAELGVAAHWRYKEASRVDAAYHRKIAWLRKVLDWRDDLADANQLAETFRSELVDDTVYALTPQGRVVDLPAGATAVDFAYQVHTELGHRCRGAKVNGKLVPLNRSLANGDVVEVVTGKEGGPSRDWLNEELGYIGSNRARSKIRQWFNNQARDEAIASGRSELEKALQRLGHSWRKPEEMAALLGYQHTEAMFVAVHRGEITIRDLRIAIDGDDKSAESGEQSVARRSDPARRGNAVLIVGLDRMLTTLARCCKPVPPDSIVGFVSKGRGISVHRSNCRNLSGLPGERLIEAQWSADAGGQRFEADVEVIAERESVSIRDVLEAFSGEKMRVVATSTRGSGRELRIAVTVETDTTDHLDRSIVSLLKLDGVAAAHRR